jgi:hypothetical protein
MKKRIRGEWVIDRTNAKQRRILHYWFTILWLRRTQGDPMCGAWTLLSQARQGTILEIAQRSSSRADR